MEEDWWVVVEKDWWVLVEEDWWVLVEEDLWVVGVVETTDLVLEIKVEVVEETLVVLEDGSDDIIGPNLPPETPEVGETLLGANNAASM